MLIDSPCGDVECIPDPAEQPREWLIRKECQEAFLALVARLPPAQRSVLLLNILENFSLEEIASISGVPLGTIKSRLFYARKAFKKLLEEVKL